MTNCISANHTQKLLKINQFCVKYLYICFCVSEHAQWSHSSIGCCRLGFLHFRNPTVVDMLWVSLPVGAVGSLEARIEVKVLHSITATQSPFESLLVFLWHQIVQDGVDSRIEEVQGTWDIEQIILNSIQLLCPLVLFNVYCHQPLRVERCPAGEKCYHNGN